MQAVQVVLFVVVAALALSLISYLLLSRVRRRRDAAGAPAPLQAQAPAGERPPEGRTIRGVAADVSRMPPPPAVLVCPACRREYPLGLKYCPHDARALVPAGDPAIRSMAPGVTCPTCRRSFDANKKFCPYDAEELVPLTMAGGAARMAAPPIPRVLGKICPHCAQRYETDATFCGRDGSELVSVN